MIENNTSNYVKYEIFGHIANISLNRPEKRNALNDQIVYELKSSFDKASIDKQVRVITLTGEGKDFCAGADLALLDKLKNVDVLENLTNAEVLMHLFIQMRQLPKPIVAKVTGRALAGGAGLASACDIVLASESSEFGYPEVKIGFIPGMVMTMLRRNISEKRAFELVALGGMISAQKAALYGLVNCVFPDSEFHKNADEYINILASRSSSALHLIKRLLYQMDGMSFEAALSSGVDANVLCRTTKDYQESITKFLNK